MNKSNLQFDRLYLGDCVDVMRSYIPDNSIDLGVTDPPYGLSFMGKDWDKALPPREAFEEFFRVLKPGALAFVMSSPRQDVLWRMLSMLEGVGFELTQSYIEWIYKTGFPKAYDVSKGIDKKLGLEREITTELKQGHSLGRKRTFGTNGIGIYGEANFPYAFEDLPTSEKAKKWDGWKSQTGLKPAHEPILMVNKPFSESTIVDNVLKWGTGAINVDVCRIPLINPENHKTEATWKKGMYSGGYKGGEGQSGDIKRYDNKGRFPANLLVSDKAIDTGETTGGGTFTKAKRPRLESWRVTENRNDRLGQVDAIDNYGDIGDQSRYFDLDAWAEHHGFLDVIKPDSSERDFGLYYLGMDVYEIVESEVTVSVCSVCGKQNIPLDPCKCEDPVWVEEKRLVKRRRKKPLNTHPTVKPIKLMAYLIELGCPPGGVVLDPFMGSGTTCISAKRLLRRYIGIELKPEYYEIAKGRVNATPNSIEMFKTEG